MDVFVWEDGAAKDQAIDAKNWQVVDFCCFFCHIHACPLASLYLSCQFLLRHSCHQLREACRVCGPLMRQFEVVHTSRDGRDLVRISDRWRNRI